MIVLDTTTLVLAKGGDHPHREACRQLVLTIGDQRLHASTTAEVLQEFTHVYARRRARSEAARLAREYADVLSPLLATTERDLRTGLRLFESHSLGAFDSVLAAVAIGNGAEALISADAGFSEIARLNHVAPGTSAFDELLRA